VNRLTIFFLLISTLLVDPLHLKAQEDSPFNFTGPKVTVEFVLSEIIRYPKEAVRARKEGRVVYQIEIDSFGNFINSTLLEETHPIFKEEAEKAMKYLEASWYPDLLGLKAPGESYLVVMTFANLNLQADPADRLAQANRSIEKGKAEKAIPILNRLIEEYPYAKEYYETRAKAFAQIRNNDEFEKNKEQIINLEKTVLSNLTTFIYNTRSKVPISF
jgi:hypothetical protein